MRRIRKAFTIIEVMIASIVFLIVIGAAMGLLTRTDQTVGASLRITDIVLQADRLSARLRDELSQAINLTTQNVATLPGANNWGAITYSKINGVNTDGTASSTLIRQLRFRYDETADGTGTGDDNDTDNDGLIDEGVLELWENSNLVGTIAQNLASNIEAYPTGNKGGEFGFQFQPNPGNVSWSGQNGVTAKFAMVTRLPVLRRVGASQSPEFHQETRTVRVAFRSASN